MAHPVALRPDVGVEGGGAGHGGAPAGGVPGRLGGPVRGLEEVTRGPGVRMEPIKYRAGLQSIKYGARLQSIKYGAGCVSANQTQSCVSANQTRCCVSANQIWRCISANQIQSCISAKSTLYYELRRVEKRRPKGHRAVGGPWGAGGGRPYLTAAASSERAVVCELQQGEDLQNKHTPATLVCLCEYG